MTDGPAPSQGTRIQRLLGRLWACLKGPHPLRNFLALAVEYEVHLPAYMFFQCYSAWQAARVPRWRPAQDRFRLGFAPGRFCRGLWRALRAFWPWGLQSFHRIQVRQQYEPRRMERPEILHVIPSLLVGGSQKIIFDLHEELGHAYRMRVLTGWMPRFGGYRGLDISVCRSAEAIALNLRARPPGLIHLHYVGLERFTRAFLEALKRVPEITAPILENNNMPVQALIDPRVAHYVQVSRYAQGLQERPAEPSSVIYPGVSGEQWNLRKKSPDAGPATVGMVYRLAHEKLNHASIEPFIELARLRPNTRMLIVGEGPYLPHYVARAKEAGVRAQFEFTGRVSYGDLPAYYDRMDLFLAPVYEESYGVVVPYAMFKGIPVLAYRVGALPEILEDEGLFCPDAKAMASRAAALLDNASEAQRIGAALHARAERFSLSAMATAYETLYATHSGRLETWKG